MAFSVSKYTESEAGARPEIQSCSPDAAIPAVSEMTMYIPPWPSLNPAEFFRSANPELPPYPLNDPAITYFYVARNGIYHLFVALGLDHRSTVLVPDYHHGNEIFAMRAAGVKLIYYPVKKNLDADMEAIAQLCKTTAPHVLYVTHFIGWPQPVSELAAVCREHGIMLIEDCALSLLSDYQGQPLGSFGEHAIFCLYKTLPLPNGGVLVQNGERRVGQLQLRTCNAMSVSGRVAELSLNWFRTRYSRLGQALMSGKRAFGKALKAGQVSRTPVGDTGFNLSAVNTSMSPLCHSLLRRFRYPQIKEARRRNFHQMQDRLRGKVSFLDRALPDGACPLFFPLLVRDKQAAARAFWNRGIDVVEFWNEGDAQARQTGSDAEFLRRHLLEVPIHQDVTPQQVDYMADHAIKLAVGL
jgi:dTDP-4-amino-4,6-dideoxygalactose transaminase